jgi:hypothetical protein
VQKELVYPLLNEFPQLLIIHGCPPNLAFSFIELHKLAAIATTL